jgi:hypothetical protein
MSGEERLCPYRKRKARGFQCESAHEHKKKSADSNHQAETKNEAAQHFWFSVQG